MWLDRKRFFQLGLVVAIGASTVACRNDEAERNKQLLLAEHLADRKPTPQFNLETAEAILTPQVPVTPTISPYLVP